MIEKITSIIVHPAFAQPKDWNSINASMSCIGGQDGDVATIGGIECLFYNISQVVIPLAGLVFFIMLIVGGFKYITAGGDPKKASSAVSTLTKSVIGIVGIIIAWLILAFIQNFTGANVTDFKISR